MYCFIIIVLWISYLCKCNTSYRYLRHDDTDLSEKQADTGWSDSDTVTKHFLSVSEILNCNKNVLLNIEKHVICLIFFLGNL